MVRCDGLPCDLLWGVPLSVLKMYKIWLPWLLIVMRIHEMFSVMEGHNINFGVDFLLLFFPFYLKNLELPNISITDVNMLPYQTPGISNQTLVYWEMWKCSRHGRTFWSKVQFFTTPLRKSGSVRDLFYLETFWRTKFLQSGIVFMVVQALHMTFSSVSRGRTKC